jgi:hypothetical protein
MKLVEEREAKAAENSNLPTTGSQDDGRFIPPRTGSPATLPELKFSGFWFDSDAIVDRRRNTLGAAEITLRRLHGDVA